MIRTQTADSPFKQDRSVQRRQKLEAAAIEVIAGHGIGGLTHRLVAAAANVSLGPTTYYFKSRADIVHAASETVLRTYAETFAAAAERHAGSGGQPVGDLVLRLLRNVVGERRTRAICWAEIALNGPRDPRSLDLNRQWQSNFLQIWSAVARAAGHADPAAVATSTVDFLMGAVFMAVALGLTEAQLMAVFRDGACPIECWQPAGGGSAPEITPRLTPKAAKTAERIVEAAITLLVQEGPAAATFAATAKLAAVTPAALSYYFPTVDTLLTVAQRRMFSEAKERYRLATRVEDGRRLSVGSLTDLTTTIFVREATEYGLRNVATFSLWLEAARKPELRGVIHEAIADQHRAWLRTLSRLVPQPRSIDALAAQCVFIGRLVRTISTGCELDALALARSEFLRDFQDLTTGRFRATDVREITGTHL